MPDRQWLKFEKLCAEIKADLCDAPYRVRHSVAVEGQDSGVSRQLDIVVDTGPNTDITFLDAKCYNRKVDVKDVEMILGLARDVRALKCGIVTTVGYTDAAYNVAEANDMDLVVLVDTGNHEWRKFISIPFCISLHTYNFSNYGFRGNIPITDMRTRDPYTGMVKLKDGRGKVYIGDYFLDEFGKGDVYGFNHPACDKREFELSVPIERVHSENDFLILTGEFVKRVNHHEKRIPLKTFSGFAHIRNDVADGKWSVEFNLEDVRTWPTISEPPKPINGARPKFLGSNLEHLRSDWED